MQPNRISYEEFLELWDSSCYDRLQRARRDIEDRRMKHSESLMMSFSDGGTTSDETDEGEDEVDMPFILGKLQPQDAAALTSTPIINNSRPMGGCKMMGGCTMDAVECFSQRKAHSLRVGWA